MANTRPKPEQADLVIGLFLQLGWGYSREALRGACEYLVSHHIQRKRMDTLFAPYTDEILAPLSGALGMFGDPLITRAVLERKMPIINTSARTRTSAIPQVIPDNRQVGVLAAQHLLRIGLNHFAFHGLNDAEWFSAERYAGFRETVAAAGKECIVLSGDAEALKAWVRDSRRPTGIMAVNDYIAGSLTQQLMRLGARVPEDFPVVGADNDDLFVQTADVALTSVDCGWRSLGRLAAEKLVHWLKTGQAPPPVTMIPPTGIVVRQSSNRLFSNDPIVDAALDLIRIEGARGLTVKQLHNRVATSRRHLDRLFLSAGRQSPATEILRTQVERACQLLVDSDLPLHRLAEASGLGTERRLRRVFSRLVGVSPLRYREQFRQR